MSWSRRWSCDIEGHDWFTVYDYGGGHRAVEVDNDALEDLRVEDLRDLRDMLNDMLDGESDNDDE
jgi:hypothetical protein